MSGRFLTERLLATTSLAALLLASGGREAQATLPCSVIVGAGQSYTNSGSVDCVDVNASSVSITNNAGASIGPSTSGSPGIFVGSGGTLTRGISNAGTIAGPGGTSTAPAIAVNGLVQGGIANSGTIRVDTTGASFNYGAIAIGAFGTISSFGGGITNSGTLSTNLADAGSGTGAVVTIHVTTFGGSIINTGTIASALSKTTPGFVGQYGLSFSASTFAGGITNGGVITVSATGTDAAVEQAAILGNFSTFQGSLVNSGTISSSGSVVGGTGSVYASGISMSGSVFAGAFENSGTISASAMVAASTSGYAYAAGVQMFASSFAGIIANSGTIAASATISGPGGAQALGLGLYVSTFGGTVTNSGTIMARADGGPVGSASATGISAAAFVGTIVNSGTIGGLITGGTGTGVGVAFTGNAHGTITNSGLIEGTTWAIDVSTANGANTINQAGGTIAGGTSGGGGAIRLSSHADTVNISGGTIVGNIQGGGTANIVNVNMGSGTFSYAGSILNVGTVNLNSGTLLLQNLTAAGVQTTNYNQAAGSILALEVSPGTTAASNHASLTASGMISLASGSTFQAFEGAFAWTPGTYTYAGMVAGGAITGSFASVTSNSPYFIASLTQGGTSDDLTLTMLSPSQVPGLNGNQKSVSNAIIGIPGGNGTLDQIFELNSAQLNTALTQLSGSQYTATNYQPLVDAWQSFSQTLSNRLAMGEGYGGTMTASYDAEHGIQFAQADIPQVAQMSDAGRSGAPSMPHQWGAWMRGYGLTSDAQATATSAAFRESGAGIIAGADNQITDRLVAGVAVNIATDKSNVSGGGVTDTNAYQGSVYGQYQIDPAWYVNGVAGFGWQTYKSARVVTLLTTTTNNGSYEGQSYRLYGESGYNLRPAFLAPNALQVTPYLGFGYLHTHTGGFTENGPTALNVQAMDEDSFTTTLGARAALTWKIGATLFHPEIRVGWQHEWLDTAGTVTAAFAQAPGSVFTATGTGFGRDSFVGGAGMTTSITSSTQLFLDYDAKANSGYTAQVISGGMRVQF